jgi:hypothetical protein
MAVMEKNNSSTDHLPVFDPALSLPHFDEETTLLSARPVVPLNEVKAETRSRRRMIFGLTILAAILLGAVSATLLPLQSGQNSQSAVGTEVSKPAEPSSGAAGGSTSQFAETRVPMLAEPVEETQAREVPTTRNSSIKSRPTEAISRRSVKPARAVSPDPESDVDFENDEWVLRRAERRGARRDARRERRQKREQMGDDLLRIREIFEGSPRP